MDGMDPSEVVHWVIGNALEAVDQETLTQLFNTNVNPDEWMALSKGETWTPPADEGDAEKQTDGDEDEMPFN